MSDKFDITVFGATGLTGKYIVEHVFELSINQPTFFNSGFRWAIAGRDASKLEQIIQEYVSKYPTTAISKPEVLVANVTSKEQLDEMTKKTKVLINAVGPFRFMGEHVVRSCVENGCNYVDITGEPEFVERMQRTYQSQAANNNATIVHCCGFDSVPTDMGVIFTKKLYTDNGWTPNDIQMYLKLHVGTHGLRVGYATFESAVHGVGSAELLREIRKASDLPKLPYPQGQKVKFHSGPHYDSTYGYHVPFMFADPSIVRLSQQIFLAGLAKTETKDITPPPTVQFAAYVLVPSLWFIVIAAFYGFVFSFLAQRTWGRRLLLDNPERFSAGIFSKVHPKKEQLNETSFELILCSNGYDHALTPGYQVPPNRSFKVVCRGPESGYVATPRIILQCALSVLNNKPQGLIPSGVLTPATAFYKTDLIDRLRYVGITYDISH